MNNYEQTLLNLKIISKIPKNGKICKTHNSFGIEIEHNTIPFFSALKRFYYGDSRSSAIDHINTIINNGFELIEQLKISHNNFNQSKLNSLLFHFEKTIIGLNNLKITYINDMTTSSKLDILITKIFTYIENYNGNNIDNSTFLQQQISSSDDVV